MKEYIKHIVEDFDFNAVKQNDTATENVANVLRLYEQSVDMGFPSGTRWFKYNLGVNPKFLDRCKDWYGNYYAWGETQHNKPEGYCWETYKFAEFIKKPESHHKAPVKRITKYIGNDGLTELESIDNVCNKIYSKCSLPTKELIAELLIYTDTMWIENFDPTKTKHEVNDNGIKGLNGRLFTSVKNENSFFIPAAGYWREGWSTPINLGTLCHLWSSTLDDDNQSMAESLYFSYSHIDPISEYRYYGLSIRPVLNK